MKTLLNKLRWVIGTMLLAGALSMGLIGIAFSAKNEYMPAKQPVVATAQTYTASASAINVKEVAALYQEECSACHIAYPVQFLPTRSWTHIMINLDNHFGENAELMPEDQASIMQFLMSNAADSGNSRIGRRVMRGVKDSVTPLRITEMPFYNRIHHEVPDKYVTGNPEVGSFSQCQACHGNAAARGIFDEDTVEIPGVRHWDD
jgi:mono/diheme cytochrome c family protein